MGGLNQNSLASVAFFVSLVALITTILQVLQQYFSSADGYRRCADSVIGLWSNGTHRKLRMWEFRIEVVFETPVIFVAPPDNKRGPIPDREIYYITGTEKSYRETRVRAPDQEKEAEEQARLRVHTADDERASWVSLLLTLQQKERESRKWDESHRHQKPPTGRTSSWSSEPEYTLAVGLQSKTRSWDFMPASITKPYATSAICHLVEMMGMLGIYWKVFDQNRWNLRAEGNGFILTSTTVHGLGVMVTFARTASSKFQDTRVIPSVFLKELTFGIVPNIFDDSTEANAQSLDLAFGKEDIINTLESLGCSAETLSRYKSDHKHIFSVAFEIVGMLGKVFRIRGSNFRMLPNPTTDPWLKRTHPQKASWKITRLMEVFQMKLMELRESEQFGPGHQINAISEQWNVIRSHTLMDEADLSFEAREAIHDVLDETTRYLLSSPLTQAVVLNVLVAHLDKVMAALSNPGSELNSIILGNKEEALLTYYFNRVRPDVVGNIDSEGKPLSKAQRELRQTIWLSLIFRMLCWYLLHDFDKSDAMIVPSELKGSRMPVFIS